MAPLSAWHVQKGSLQQRDPTLSLKSKLERKWNHDVCWICPVYKCKIIKKLQRAEPQKLLLFPLQDEDGCGVSLSTVFPSILWSRAQQAFTHSNNRITLVLSVHSDRTHTHTQKQTNKQTKGCDTCMPRD